MFLKRWFFFCVFGVILSVFFLKFLHSDKLNSEMFEEEFNLSGEGCLILNYHRIRNSNPLVKTIDKLTTLYQKDAELLYYSVYKDEFQEQVDYLLKHKFQFITPNDLINYMNQSTPMPDKCVMVTFDDVDISVYKNAFPYLVENRVPFTLFIITGNVGNENFNGLKLASWNQIKKMQESELVTIGAHTHHMHYLEKKQNPPFLNRNNLEQFEEDSKATVETFIKELGYAPKHFAYPYGFGMPQTDKVLQGHGYQMIYTLKPGLVKSQDSPYSIKRVLITRGNWGDVIDWVEVE